MSKTAIVIGATGLVGAQVVEQLVLADHIDRVITISRRPDKHLSNKVVNQVVEFENLTNHAALFKGDILFSCLGTTAKSAGSISAQRVVDLDYQLQAAQLASAQGVSHYLLVSSSGANKNSASPYLKMKGQLEDQISTLDFKHISIFQPSLLLGHRDQTRTAESVGAVVLPWLCKLPGLYRYRPITGQQVAKKMVAVSAAPVAKFETFTLDQVFPN